MLSAEPLSSQFHSMIWGMENHFLHTHTHPGAEKFVVEVRL